MKFLSSTWGLMILAILLTIGTTGGMLYAEKDSFWKAPADSASVSTATMWSFKPDEVDSLMAQLRDERKKLDVRSADLDRLGEQVKSERAELEKVRAAIQISKDELAASISEVQEGEVKQIKQLAQTYSALSPVSAVAIFSEMDDAMAVKILANMKADTVGAIFQEMARPPKDPKDLSADKAKRAARLSDKIRLFKTLKKAAPQP